MLNNISAQISFLQYLKVECGARRNTLDNYGRDVRKFAEWLGRPFTSATRVDLQRYLSESLQSGTSARSVARRRSCLRHFYRFLIDEEEMQNDPTRNLPVPKSWTTVPRSLSVSDLDAMVASLGSSWIAVRDKAILLTFFGSGLRESELAALKLQDVDLGAGAAKVWNGKNGRDGIVPLSPPAVAALKVYFDTARPKLAGDGDDPHVFLTIRGGPLIRQTVWVRVRNIAAAALGKHVSPHALRHGFATTLVEGGADIRDVQVLMRHSSVDTTSIYVHTNMKYLRGIYYATHPRARISKA